MMAGRSLVRDVLPPEFRDLVQEVIDDALQGVRECISHCIFKLRGRV